jgi:hypothetical protein
MEKRDVVKGLHAMIATRLFSDRPWLANRESCDALDRKLLAMGVQENVTRGLGAKRNTDLGREMQMDLMMVFIGLWDEWEIPNILEEYGLIDQCETMRIYETMEYDPERVLLPIVRKAFRDYFNPSLLSS